MECGRFPSKTLAMLSIMADIKTNEMIRFARCIGKDKYVLRDIQILKRVSKFGLSQTARDFGLSRQRVYQIVHEYCLYALEIKKGKTNED